jgi:hypothetical protein
MSQNFCIHIDAWSHGCPIPAKFAFGRPGEDTPFATSDNISPAVRWSNPPTGSQSFVILCHDSDVPSSGADVNQTGKIVPADLPRVNFFHWVLINIPIGFSSLEEGAASNGITPRGKPVGQTNYGLTGKNDYSEWFLTDPDMEGIYGSYDGPCPPWNDSIIHHYHFDVFALDVETLEIKDGFSGPEVLTAMEGHILAKASHMGTYTMNPSL